MGLWEAAAAAARGVAGDQWLEYFNCEALPESVLAVKGRKWVNSRGQAVGGSDNVISNGSRIAVADGQCMIIVEQGRILDVCAEPGEYVFDLGSEQSMFGGEAVEYGAAGSLRSTWERFKFGGHPGKDTRVYFVNTKELLGNKYGTPIPVPFRVVDANIGLDVDISIRFFGQYSYRICDPIAFYMNVAGNFPSMYMRDQIQGQLKAELLAALQPAIAMVSAMGVRYSALPACTAELTGALNAMLAPTWRELRGLELVSVGVTSVAASAEDEQMIKELQRTAVLRDPGMAAATLVSAQAAALEAAASNEAGAMTGLLGLGTVQGAAGTANPDALYALARQQAPPPTAPAVGPNEPAAVAAGWACACGATGTGKFCADCGAPKPPDPLRYQCDKCGWAPPEATTPSRFCPECGDPIDARDQV